MVLSIFFFCEFNRGVIVEGDNRYSIKFYSVQKDGLNLFYDILGKSEKIPDKADKVNIAYMSQEVDDSGILKSFVFSADLYDSDNQYAGTVSYSYNGKVLSYSAPFNNSSGGLLVHSYDENCTIKYLDEQIKKIPLVEQIKKADLPKNVLCYEPYTTIEEGTPIFDGRNSDSFEVLDKASYDEGQGGVSDGNTSVVIRLYDGVSLVSPNQYIYVFTPATAQIAPGYGPSYPECDYYLNNGTIMFMREHGAQKIPVDISKAEIEETLDFHRNYLSLPVGSWFISPDESLPIAFFTGKSPVLNISRDNGKTWDKIPFKFSLDDEYTQGMPITRRIVGFKDSQFGFVAIGTDYSMGTGEIKECFFTFDGGKTWESKKMSPNTSTNPLYDMEMADTKNGIMILDAGYDVYFPTVLFTDDMGTTWNEIEIDFDSITDKIDFLTDIYSFEYSDGVYTLTLGQGEMGTKKAVFTSTDPYSGWEYKESFDKPIHTVG